MRKEESTSSLKKRSKELLAVGVRGHGPRTPISKGFLVLFFKKEHLSSCGGRQWSN
jgi:hypothetical protein